jgi:hypothetical protein
MMIDELLYRHYFALAVLPGPIAFVLACLAVARCRRHAPADGRPLSYVIVPLSIAALAMAWTVHLASALMEFVKPTIFGRVLIPISFVTDSPTAIIPIAVLAIYFSRVNRLVRGKVARSVIATFTALLLLLVMAAQLKVFYSDAQAFHAEDRMRATRDA